MNIQPQSKVCPRCRFTLSKTYSEKMICKRCGYTSNKLQIVAEEDTFNTNIKFSKRVTIKQDTPIQQETKNQDILQTYLMAYQSILKHLGESFINNNVKDSVSSKQTVLQNYKNLWMGFLQKMCSERIKITGIFNLMMQKSQRKQGQKGIAKVKQLKEEKQEESDEGLSSGEEQVKSEEQSSQKQQQNDESKKKRPLIEKQEESEKQSNEKKKKQSNKDETMREYKKYVNSLLKSIKAIKQSSYQEFKKVLCKQLLQKLISFPKQRANESSFASLTYLSDRYCWILMLGQSFKNHKTKRKAKQSLLKRIEMKYVRQQELREMCQQRGLKYQKRRLYGELGILCYDLLDYWYKKENMAAMSLIGQHSRYPFQYLLQFFKSTGSKPWLIVKIIGSIQMMSKQTVVKQEENSKKVPELSLKFIIAAIHLSLTISQQPFTILQVSNHAIGQCFNYLQQIRQGEDKVKFEIMCLLIKEKNLKVKRVKKVAHKLFNYMLDYLPSIHLSLQNWVHKFSQLYGLPQKMHRQLTLLAQTLLNGYRQDVQVDNHRHSNRRLKNGNILVNNFSERYVLLEQGEIVLACLVIYMKLRYGLDRSQYPYLINIAEVWAEILQKKQYLNDEERQKVQFVSKLFSEYSELFNMDAESGQSLFGLLKLLEGINSVAIPLKSMNELKYISNKDHKELSSQLNKYRLLVAKKQKESSYLSLVYNLNNNNNTNHQFNDQVHPNNEQFITVKYNQHQQQQSSYMQANTKNSKNQKNKTNKKLSKSQKSNPNVTKTKTNQKNKTKSKKYTQFNLKMNKNSIVSSLFSDPDLVKTVRLNPNLFRAIDFFQDKYQRFHSKLKREKHQNKDEQTEKEKMKQGNQEEQKNSLQGDQNENSRQGESEQFVIEQYLDLPMGHYQIVYQPTINSLNQLQLKQLLILVESISYFLNGEFTDCSDVLEWVGYLQSVLKLYQN